MAKTKTTQVAGHAAKRLALKWEKIPVIRKRVRKGKDWVRMVTNDEGEIVISTQSLQWNRQALMLMLEEFGLKSQPVDVLVAQAWFCQILLVPNWMLNLLLKLILLVGVYTA